MLMAIAIIPLSYAQVGQGALKGKLIDKTSGEPLPFANIVVERNGIMVAGGTTDIDGKYTIKPIPPGKYNVKATYTGYQPIMITGVIINANKITFKDVNMSSKVVNLAVFEKVEYVVPLISKDNTSSGGTITREDIQRMPGRSATSVAQTVGGVYSKENSGDLNIRGARSDANYYFIDGIKVRGSTALPKSAIEQVTVITGGIPAQYGDVTGGVISITTRGASSYYFGGLEYVSSGYKIGDKTVGLDGFGYNLIEGNISGPMFMKKDSTGKKSKPLFGFFLSGNISSVVDGGPSNIGMWKIKDGELSAINANPLRYSNTGPGTFMNAEFLRLNDFEKVRYKQNVASRGIVLAGKVDVNTTQNTSLTFGGNLNFRKQHRYLYSYSLMNWENNPERIQKTWRAYTRFTQRFNAGSASQEEKSASTIKNAYYSIQVDYNKDLFTEWDDSHKDRLFNYGYIGKFITYMDRDFGPGTYVNNDGDTMFSLYVQETFVDTLIAFIPDTNLNPEGAQFTTNYYQLYGWDFDNSTATNPLYNYALAQDPNQPENPNFYLRNFTNLQTNGGYINGDFPKNVYGLWRSPALQFNGYDLRNETQFRVSATGSADIGKSGDHAISIGFEYEQRVDRRFFAAPVGLWTIARQYTNNHITNLDFSKPDTLELMGQNAVIIFPRQNASPGEYNADKEGGDAQYFFDYNLRKKLGLDTDGVDWIDFDSYGPETYSIDMFSADELLNSGNSYVSYYGYDHHGNKLKKNPSFDDFFTDKDGLGNFTRPIDAFRPIYVAGYIQDKFSFDDLIFNIGLRVDRFDANQKVPIDPYVLFPTVKAGEDEAMLLAGENGHPETISDDFVVYVDNLTNPQNITGYRDGDTWYNASGTEIENPDPIKTGSGIAPLLVDNTKTNSEEIQSDAFEDYKPQTTLMPRIAFSFPISDEALFFAHYDVLAKRPTSGLRLDPTNYYFLPSQTRVNNPNLKPEKTIDYELGFQQVLSKSSSLKLSAFYREMRDQIQIINILGAFPGKGQYETFGNIDFGTIKGMTVSFDLRRTRNVWMRAAYTLQFAEGTGSDATSQVNLVRSGNPNLRMTNPLNYDQRHTIVTTFDYRLGAGKDYNGPVWFGKQVFSSTGMNLIFNAGSGAPYSKQISPSARGWIAPQSGLLDGKINGARLPWSFRMDARIDKDFELTLGKGEEEDKKPIQMNVYLEIFNVLNSKNTINVYRATGNPDDDGYLAAAEFQNAIQGTTDEQSYREMYSMRINNPANYNLPRRIRLGVMMNF